MKRRSFIKCGLATFGISALGGYTFLKDSGLSYAGPSGKFTNRLPIPPLLEYNLDADGRKNFLLKVQTGVREFAPGLFTKTMGYNGSYLGPTIRVQENDRIKIQVDNELNQQTTVHWHGLHVPAKWDGGPRQVIPVGASWHPEFTIKQPAATLWYHPHAMGLTGEQVYNGLAGIFIIEDKVSKALSLPQDYGINDFPIIIQDRRFFSNGRFAYVQNMMDVMHGVVGNTLLVNGVKWPKLDVPKGLVRLRVLNGSNSSIYRITFQDNRNFFQIATDGGFQENPVPLSHLLLSAGERSEIIVDFSKDSENANLSLLVEQLPGSRFEAMQFVVGKPDDNSLSLHQKLTNINWLWEEQATQIRRFSMETVSMGMGGMSGARLTINGKNMDLGYINEKVKLGSTEIWVIENFAGMMMRFPHSMHLHDVQFQILDRNGKRPPPEERGRKDTVLVAPGERVRIISQFRDYTGIYMYHCHLLEHEDNGMMGQFEVIP